MARLPKLTGNGAGTLLVFGGPYSNLQATRAIRAEAGRRGIAACNVVCTGDVAAYCANPNETIAELRDWGCHIIKGNCEEQLAAGAADCGCGFGDGTACDLLSQQWYSYCDRVLDADNRTFLAELPATLRFEIGGVRLRVIHGAVRETSRFIFASTSKDLKFAEFDAAEADVIIAGHCGLPFVERIGERVWFNPGVIGMPANDGTPDVWYGLVEFRGNSGGNGNSELTFGLHRLGYDAVTAAAALETAGFAQPYATALLTGRWPSLDVLPDDERAATGLRLVETICVMERASQSARSET